jgi:putative CRISPR-associated protein (TIGR02619 family)
MNFILTSCGLSILTNSIKEKYSPNEVYKYANMKREEIDSGFLHKIEKALDTLKNDIVSYSNEDLKKISAELNALVTFYNGDFKRADFHLLLHTDTYLGEQTSNIIEHFLRHKGLQVQKLLAKDLKTSSVEEFELSLSEVINELSEIIEGYKNNGYEIIFNLTGGFKGSNSFLQTMASLYADKSIYIFEAAKELLTVPRLPIKLDEALFENNINIFRGLELGLEIDTKKVEKLPKSIVNHIGDEYIISPWGEMAWQKYKKEYYQKNIIDPISEKIKYSENFIKDVNSLDPSELYQLNKAIDKLEKYVSTGKNLKSLNYHELKGEISKKYSHEFYPFDGNNSRRAYCNEENGVVIIENIDAHLK